MVDVMVFVECWYSRWCVDVPSISSSILEYGLKVSSFLPDADLGQVPEGRRRTQHLNETMSSSKILSSSSLFIWLLMTVQL